MMKIITTLCLVLLSVHSYSQEIIPEVETVARNSLMYHQDTNELVTGTVEYFHDNGQLRERGNWINGKRNGLYESFHENGQLKERRNYVYGEQDGLFEVFDRNGNLRGSDMWRNGEYVPKL